MSTLEIPNGNLRPVAEALGEVGRDRPWRVALKVARLSVRLREEAGRVEQERLSLIRQYDPTGQGWADVADAPPDFIEALGALLGESYAIEAEPLKASAMDRADDATDHDDSENVAMLLHFGVIVDDVEDE